MAPTVIGCLQTVDGVGRGIHSEMDPLSFVIEEVQTMEIKWQEDDVSLQEHQTPVPFQQLCRLCALETSNLVSVFGEEGSSIKLADKIFCYLPIEVCLTLLLFCPS